MKRLTKEQAQKAKEGERYKVDMIEECILCGYKEYGGVLLTKIPEMVSQCIPCAEKYEDNESKGRGVYIIGHGFVEK